jgi:hypothetical protein
MDWLERKGASVFYIGGNDHWRTQYGLAIHILIRTAYENATEVIIKLPCLYFVRIPFFFRLFLFVHFQVSESGRPETFALSPFYNQMLQELLMLSNRFRYALQSVCHLLACTPEDCYPSMIEYTELVFLHLRQVTNGYSTDFLL